MSSETHNADMNCESNKYSHTNNQYVIKKYFWKNMFIRLDTNRNVGTMLYHAARKQITLLKCDIGHIEYSQL